MSNIQKVLPSFTYEPTSHKNVQRFVDKNKDWTHYWLKKEKKFVKAVNYILDLGYNKGERFNQYLLSVSREEARKTLEEKGDIGTRTHQALRDVLAGIKVTKETKYFNEITGRQEELTWVEWEYLLDFKQFCKDYKPQTVDYEYTVYNDYYAGTADWLCVITIPDKDKKFDKDLWGKKVIILIDFKTSSGIWDNYEAQVAAYFKADNLHSKFYNIYPNFTGILRLGSRHKCGYEFQVWNIIKTLDNFTAFNAAYVIARKKQPDFNPEIQKIPVTLDLKVPKAKLPRKAGKASIKRKKVDARKKSTKIKKKVK